jgi:hypothetical protein
MAPKNARIQKNTRNISYLVFFHVNNAYANAPSCYFISTLHTLLELSAGCETLHKLSHFLRFPTFNSHYYQWQNYVTRHVFDITYLNWNVSLILLHLIVQCNIIPQYVVSKVKLWVSDVEDNYFSKRLWILNFYNVCGKIFGNCNKPLYANFKIH